MASKGIAEQKNAPDSFSRGILHSKCASQRFFDQGSFTKVAAKNATWRLAEEHRVQSG